MSNFRCKREANCNRYERVGSLYYLDCLTSCQNVNIAENSHQGSKEVWHRRFGHLGVRNLQKLAKDELVSGYDYDVSNRLDFVSHVQKESITGDNLLPLVDRGHKNHSVSCIVMSGKMNTKLLSGAEYFLTFIDDCTRYV